MRTRIEVKTLFSLRHPNLIPLIGYCDNNGRKAIIMDYVNGTSLKDLLGDIKTRLKMNVRVCN